MTVAVTATVALLAAAPAHAATKNCGTVFGVISQTYKVKVPPTSIKCSTARAVLNSVRASKRIPANGHLVRTYRCRAPGAVIAGGYVTSKWICKKGSRSIVGTSVQQYTG